MAAADFPIYFTVSANSTQAIASFQSLNGEMDKVVAKTEEVSATAKKSESSFAGFGKVIFGVTAAIGYMGYQGIKQLNSVEDAQAQLTVAVKNTGISYNTAKPFIDASAASMRNLGFETQDTYGALTILTASSRNPETALKTLGVAADLARFKQISLTQAATLLSRATIGQARGLGDLGIAIGKTIPKGSDLQTILAAVEERAQGSAVAFKSTLSGGIAVATANFKNLEVQVGTALVPKLESLTTWINDKGLPDLKKLFTFISDNKGTLESFAIVWGSIWSVSKITAGVTAAVSAINKIKEAYIGLRAVLITTGIAEAFATAGVSVGTATAALAAVGGLAYLSYETPKVIKEFTGGAKPDYSQQYRPGVGTPSRGSINSGKSPAVVSTPAKSTKTSIRKSMRGTTDLGTGVHVNVYVDGSAAVAKSMTSGAPLKKGGK